MPQEVRHIDNLFPDLIQGVKRDIPNGVSDPVLWVLNVWQIFFSFFVIFLKTANERPPAWNQQTSLPFHFAQWNSTGGAMRRFTH